MATTTTTNGVASVTQQSIAEALGAQTPKHTKLHGRAFYESIGSPNFVLAPMVDASEFAWRMLTRSYMTCESNKKLVAYTPMLHSRLFTETEKFRSNSFLPIRAPLKSAPDFPYTGSEADLYLDGNPAIDRPLFVQFCANEPEVLLKAAQYVAPFCDAVDLNLGCPQGIAKKGAYGAFLQEDQELIYRLINILHLNLPIPVTAKIRILETREKTLAYAQKVLKAGASILTVHGRVRDAKGHKTGLADWSYIRYLRENLPEETVIFANGNILQRGDIDKCLEATGADAVMSAEGNLYDPGVFADPPAVGDEGHFYWRGKDGKGGFRMDDAMRRYLDILYKYVLDKPAPIRKPLYIPGQAAKEAEAAEEESETDGPPRKRARMNSDTEVSRANGATAAETKAAKAQEKNKQKNQRERVSNPNLTPMQAHCFHMLRALVNKHHNVRDALAKSRAGDIDAYEGVLSMVEEAVEKGIREYEATDGASYHAEFEGQKEEGHGPKVDTFVEAPMKEGDMEEGAIKKVPAEDAAVVDAEDVAASAGAEAEKPSEAYETSLKAVEECRRPWWVCQPYVRPLPLEAVAKGSLTLSKKEMAKLSQEEREKAMSMGMYKSEAGEKGISKKEQKRLAREEAKKAAKAANGAVGVQEEKVKTAAA